VSRGQERHNAGALDGGRQFSLVPGADAGAASRQDFHVEIYEAAQSARVFVVDIQIVNAKIAFFRFFVGHNFNFY